MTGYAWTANRKVRAFRWTPLRGMQDLETLGGECSNVTIQPPDGTSVPVNALGRAINDRGEVTGDAGTANGSCHAFR